MADDVPPLRLRHHPPVAGEIRRTDADLPDDARRARLRTAAVAASISGTRPSSPSLVATSTGAIARLLLTIPSYAVEGGDANPYAVVYRDLIAKLPAETALVILTHDAVADAVRGWLATAGRTAAGRDAVVATDDFLGFSVWAEDGYVVISDGAGAAEPQAFVEPAAFPRYADALVADQVSASAQLGLYQAPLHFQGGNVLIGDDFFFIGIDYPLLTFAEGILTAPTQAGEDDLLREVYRRYLDAARTFVPVGTTLPVPAAARRELRLQGAAWVEDVYAGNAPGTRQPIFHIDMFVSLAGRGADGRYRVLVGDPRAAAQLTNEPLQPHAMAPVFDDIARDLTRRGYAVTRTPLPLVYSDDADARVRSWYFATSNNVLVHAPEGARPTVFIPTYAHGPFADTLAATDRRNAEIWEGLGYDVVGLGDFHPFAINLGAAHCIKKFLARG
ncbi:MAG: hypothetical protein QOG42_1350 [Solirubrobacteraceae bacterium]|jgi:hypothetical protein|nr:hypothetical protein [Solirubrobacteraceae bacterium]